MPSLSCMEFDEEGFLAGDFFGHCRCYKLFFYGEVTHSGLSTSLRARSLGT